jgi:multidrug efflux pump
MSLSSPFIKRPVGTTLLTIAIALAGTIAYVLLPVSPLPQVEFPTISVSANLPGADPATMASSVATPLERQFGRIAGITEMTSSSSLGNTQITIHFDLNRDIDAATRDVQAAINAARGQLPANLPNNPGYRKSNPADAPILILSITSDVYNQAQMYDAATSILQQKISQVEGVGEVRVGGSSNPAVRVEVNPRALNNLGLSLEDVRTTLSAANANRPKGSIQSEDKSWSLSTTDQLFKAKEYKGLILNYQKGGAVRIGDVAGVTDSVEDIRNAGTANAKPAVLLFITRQPEANMIDTVERIRAMMGRLDAEFPAAMNLQIAMDRTTTIRASVHDVQFTLVLSICLVILVVFIFLRDVRSTLIPSVAVPVSLIGTFGVMYLLGYSIDNLSMMAMTIATGFVVDDAIVVVENITRHLEAGMKPKDAALLGAKEIGFTVMSISISLIAVFIPLLLMGGIVGRLFREFAVTLSIAILISMVISLTTTPMMCAVLLQPHNQRHHGRLYRASEWIFDRILRFYESSLRVVLRHQFVTLMVTLGTIALTVCLYIVVPKGFFPQQDTGRLTGVIRADQDSSFLQVNRLLTRYVEVLRSDENVEDVIAFSGNTGARMFLTLKPLGQRKLTADQVIGVLRRKTSQIAGATLVLQAVQDLRIGGRSSNAQFQYTLQGDNLAELRDWSVKMYDAIKKIPGVVDVNSDLQNAGLQSSVEIDRVAAARLGVSTSAIDATLGDAFGQRPVSTMYESLNQYRVVMEVAPQFRQNPSALDDVYVAADDGSLVPLSAVAHFKATTAPLSVSHSGQFPSITISFTLAPGLSLGDAVDKVNDTARELGMPANIIGKFFGTTKAYEESRQNQPILILAAVVCVYLILGILYESLIHPITILSTLPSAGVGALLALLLCGTDLSVIALIGIILLIGIVKKNAIMMIDFALEAERHHKKSPADAIFEAAVLRFRPITMTTLAALLGGLPLALGAGTGSELRRPLGIAIVGGLIFSQMLTLYTTPVVYVYLDRLRIWLLGEERDRAVADAIPARIVT